MGLENLALTETGNFPIRHVGKVHEGKVRAVYWLNEGDSVRLASQRGYSVFPSSQLGVMITSDRISAFECGWKAENGLNGVPGKGAVLNAVSQYWFDEFKENGIAGNHLLEAPHPLVWIVQKAHPIMVEGIVRGYITGSMWSKYEKGQREFCGNKVPDGLTQHQQLPEALFTPTTKGIMTGIPGVPEKDDVDVDRITLVNNWQKFGFKNNEDVFRYRDLAIKAYNFGREQASKIGEIVADTKFEVGYIQRADGLKMELIDEVLTPDSSRFWPAEEYSRGQVVEKSKEDFRGFLKGALDKDILTDKNRMEERVELARAYRVPVQEFYKVSQIYTDIASKITGKIVRIPQNPRQEILDALSPFGILN
ncbi:MAG: phosphoribosylaminoimidazolesuccinocarboxamide synthase [Nanoarchaeota archaeon]